MTQQAIKYIIVHCSATPAGRNVTAADIDRYHRKRGFSKIGYHYVVRLDGTIEEGRPVTQIGAHCLGKNDCSIGVCYVGGIDSDGRPVDTRTPAQKRALLSLLTDLRRRYPQAEIVGHRDFAAKACPSFDARREYRTLGIAAFFALLTTSGCKSHSDMVAVSQSELASAAHIDLSHNLTSLLTDSLQLELTRPVLTMTTGDSVSAVLTADKAAIRRQRTQHTVQQQSAAISDTTHTIAVTASRTTSDVRPTATASIGATLLCIGIATVAVVLIRRLFHTAKQ